MKLKPDIDTVAFLKAVSQCSGEVYFISEENDQLNLKSVLSAYIFLATTQGNRFLEKGCVMICDEADMPQIASYLL